MKNLRVGVKLDKSGFQKELNQLLKGNYNIKLDSSNFKTTIDGINKIKDSIKDLNTELTKMSNKNLASTSITADKNGITEVNKYRDSITQTTTEIIKNGKVTKQTITENIAQFEKLRNQMQSKLSSVVGSKFIDESVISKLQSQLSSLNTNSSVQEFNELKVAIDNVVASNKELQKQAEQALKEQQKQAQQAIKDEEKLIQQMARLREQSQARVDKDNSKWQLNQAQAINKALDEQYNLQQKQISSLDKLKSQMQQKLTVSASNNLVDTSTIDKLQQKLNSLNTNSSEKEIKELQNAINNLSSADGSIVRVQQQIIRLEERINKIKNNKIDLMTTSELSELRQAESELEKLRNTLSALKSGEIINGKAISNQINQANNSMRTLETSMRELNTTGSGLANTFKEIFSYALGGSGIYLVLNSFRDMIDTTISLDTSMRDLKRTTDESNDTYSRFMKSANETAVALGTTTSGAIDAVSRFTQLGYSFDQAADSLSRYALVLSNVADMDASSASSTIVSVLKGFQLETDDVSRIVDVINEAG